MQPYLLQEIIHDPLLIVFGFPSPFLPRDAVVKGLREPVNDLLTFLIDFEIDPGTLFENLLSISNLFT